MTLANLTRAASWLYSKPAKRDRAIPTTLTSLSFPHSNKMARDTSDEEIELQRPDVVAEERSPVDALPPVDRGRGAIMFLAAATGLEVSAGLAGGLELSPDACMGCVAVTRKGEGEC